MHTKNKISELPHCNYPTAQEIELSGLLSLPDHLSEFDLSKLESFRTDTFEEIGTQTLENTEVLELTKMLAKSFVTNEPTNRHLKTPEKFPEALNRIYTDAYGESHFGEWTKENIFYWLIRLVFLTKPSDDAKHITKNQDILELSLAVKNASNKIVAGVLSQSVSIEESSMRNDSYLSTILGLYSVSLDFIFSQEHEAISALTETYPDFKASLDQKKVATALMLAKDESFAKEDAFELFIRAIELLQTKGFKYVLVAGSNQWTGAACEMFNATKVHYKPFRDHERVAKTSDAPENELHSEDGYLAAKDSGIMYYIIKF